MRKENGDREPEVFRSRRTRSHNIAPDWTAADCLVLVNVIAAVEADCLKALSSYQKWKIVAENCTSLDVTRTSNQCRRKWDCLLIEQDVIKQWESEMPDDDSYWCLESGRRKELGLPDNFDEELFKAIDNVATMRANQSDTEPDSDPEAAMEIVDEIVEPGPKRQRRRSMSKRNQALEQSPICEEDEEEKPLLRRRSMSTGNQALEQSTVREEDEEEKPSLRRRLSKRNQALKQSPLREEDEEEKPSLRRRSMSKRNQALEQSPIREEDEKENPLLRRRSICKRNQDLEQSPVREEEEEEEGPPLRRRSMSKRNQALEKSLECERNQALEKSIECEEEKEKEKEKPPLKSPEVEGEYNIKSDREKASDNIETEEQMTAKKLLENAEKVKAIVSENAEYATSDEKNDKDRTNLVRCQGSKLIRCLGDILNSINDLRGLLEDCE